MVVTSVAFHYGVPFRTTVCRGEPGHVAREIVAVSVDSDWLQVCVDVVLSSLPCFRYSFCLVDIAGFQSEISFVQRPSLCLTIIACFQHTLPCLRIHDVISFAARDRCCVYVPPLNSGRIEKLKTNYNLCIARNSWSDKNETTDVARDAAKHEVP